MPICVCELFEYAIHHWRLQGDGEIGLQYEGLSPSDPSVDRYFALSEELGIPVAIHMGTGGSGRANVTSPKHRGSLGDRLVLSCAGPNNRPQERLGSGPINRAFEASEWRTYRAEMAAGKAYCLSKVISV